MPLVPWFLVWFLSWLSSWLLSWLLTLFQRGSSVVFFFYFFALAFVPRNSSVVDAPSQPLQLPLEKSPPEVQRTRIPDSSSVFHLQRCVQMVQDLRLSGSLACNWLDPKDVSYSRRQACFGGGLTTIYMATLNNRKVLLKSYHFSVMADTTKLAAVRSNHILSE
jgi:hypothetical protein